MEILNDFNTSVEKALSEIDPNWKEYEGLIVCGTHSPKNWEEQIEKIKNAREKGLPFLGICAGMQLMLVEILRFRGVEDAVSEEWGIKGTPVIIKMDKLRVGLKEGESYWHNYTFNKAFEDRLIPMGKMEWSKEFVKTKHWEQKVLKEFRVEDDFLGVQYHPEYQSSKDKPHPILVEFLKHAREYKSR